MLAFEHEFTKVVTDLWNANKTITNPGLRRELGRLLTQSAPRLTADKRESALPAATALARDGFHFLNSNKFDISGAVDQLKSLKVFTGVIAGHGDSKSDHAKDFSLEDRPKDALIVRYHFEDIIRCQPLLRLAVDPSIVSIVEAYMGCTPTIASYQAWWTFPGDEILAPEIFHRDRDDFNFVKLFVYLNDVGDDAGPHEFIQFSHNPDAMAAYFKSKNIQTNMARLFDGNARDVPHSELKSIFGDKIKSFTGKAGTIFLEDTFGMHRGTRPTKSPRLIFSVSYTGIPLRFATKTDRAEEMSRKTTFADAGLNKPSELEKYLFRFFLN